MRRELANETPFVANSQLEGLQGVDEGQIQIKLRQKSTKKQLSNQNLVIMTPLPLTLNKLALWVLQNILKVYKGFNIFTIILECSQIFFDFFEGLQLDL